VYEKIYIKLIILNVDVLSKCRNKWNLTVLAYNVLISVVASFLQLNII